MGIRRFVTILLLVVVMGIITFTRAEGQQPGADLLVLTDEQVRYSLGRYMAILEDPTGELTVDQVASPEYAERFVPGSGEIPNLGFTQSAYWVRIRVENQARSDEEWLLVMTDPRMQYIDLYTPAPNGTGFTVRQTGALRPFTSRDLPDHQFIFRLSLPQGSEQTLYLRFQTTLAMTFPLRIWSWDSFIETGLPASFKLGIFYGALIIMLGYNFFLLLSLREASYLYYVLFLIFALATRATLDGLPEQYLWPESRVAIDSVVLVSFALTNLSALQFTNVFLVKLVRIRWLSWLFNGMMVGWGVIIAFLLFGHSTGMATNWMVVITSFVLVIAGVIVLRNGYRQARYFLVAWPGFFIPLAMVRLVRLGVLPTTFLWEDVHFALLWLVLFWSVALIDRINLLKSEAETANQALNQSERRLNQFLEAMPVGVSVYGPDRVVQYTNELSRQILSNPERGILSDFRPGRTIEQAAGYFSLQTAGTNRPYPVDRLPLSQALRGEPAYADDIEADLVDRRIPLEVWANPILNEDGEVQYAVAAFQDITRRRQVEVELEQHRQHLEELVATRTEELTRTYEQLESETAQRLEQARLLAAATERDRLARDLHDSVTQILFSANLIAEVLPQRWQRSPEDGQESLMELRRLTRGALAEMRTLLLELRPEALTRIPLGELIAQLTEAVTSRDYLPFELYLDNVPPLQDQIQVVFYRVAQEALNNAVKHAHAKRVSVSLNAMPTQGIDTGNGWRGQVKLTIRDDGVGFKTDSLGGEKMGLGIMRERANAIGADLSIESRSGAGTTVTLTWESD